MERLTDNAANLTAVLHKTLYLDHYMFINVTVDDTMPASQLLVKQQFPIINSMKALFGESFFK